MVSTKLVVVALVAFYTLQVSGLHIQTVNNDDDDVIDQAAKLLHTVTDFIKNAVEFSTNILNNLIKDFQLIHDNAENYAKALIDAELKILNELIDSAKKNTTAKAASILQCIEDVENDLAEVQKLVLVNAATCSNGSVLVLLHDAEQVLASFSQVDQNVDAQADALLKCKGQSAPATCFKGIVNHLFDIVNQIPADFKDEITKIEKDFNSMAEIVLECTLNAVPDFFEKVNTLKENFEKCVG